MVSVDRIGLIASGGDEHVAVLAGVLTTKGQVPCGYLWNGMVSSGGEEKRVVGVSTLGYPEMRNIAGLPFERYRVRKVQNLNKVPAWLYFKFAGNIPNRYWNTFRDLDLSSCALYHFFNGVSVGRKPWLTTFETVLPRWNPVPDKKVREGLELLARSSCKGLIALSECNARLQREHVAALAPELADRILPKLTVLHPAQAPGIMDLSEKPPIKDQVVFTFVGADLFRKGGREMLQAFDEVHRSGFRNWRLNIVSTMQVDYATKATTTDVQNAKALIAKYPDHIVHHQRLANKDVLALFKASHVCLLPSWAETYGYSVLEAQAYGVPVITTNVRAMPEINSDHAGWMIEVPLNEKGNAVLVSDDDRARFSNHLQGRLVHHLRSILTDPSVVLPRARASLERIRTAHDPATKAAVLEALYDTALGG